MGITADWEQGDWRFHPTSPKSKAQEKIQGWYVAWFMEKKKKTA